ncbi:hypothetical protein TIFTF001_046209 [Ficus carica]|uniref:Uncharacterized protein n=1 Tax=Ficus carica TaxID=3494 RepID=A0AA87Z3U7_FICCA|nr:hypothetical protein TIFTF001_046209 [Ficus carica]
MNNLCKRLRYYTWVTEFEPEEEYTVDEGGSGQEAIAFSAAFATGGTQARSLMHRPGGCPSPTAGIEYKPRATGNRIYSIPIPKEPRPGFDSGEKTESTWERGMTDEGETGKHQMGDEGGK